jgi:hypothetical protein
VQRKEKTILPVCKADTAQADDGAEREEEQEDCHGAPFLKGHMKPRTQQSAGHSSLSAPPVVGVHRASPASGCRHIYESVRHDNNLANGLSVDVFANLVAGQDFRLELGRVEINRHGQAMPQLPVNLHGDLYLVSRQRRPIRFGPP